MVVSKKLLAQWIDIMSISDEQITSALISLGFEVEKVINLTKVNTNLVVGQITKITKHPKINRLNICDVNIGNNHLQIICGADNVIPNLKVVVAKIGATLANGMHIVRREIQGIDSYGMICSLTELGVSESVQSTDELSGITHLPDYAALGSNNPLKYLELDDSIFEIQLTISRSDCLSMYSIAQELSSYFKIILKPMAISDLSKLNKSEKQISVNNSLIKALASLKIRLSNHVATIKTENNIYRTLQLANIKPVNFIDDLVNLVMLELGQPIMALNGELLKQPAIYTSSKDYASTKESPIKIFVNDITLNNNYLTVSTLGLETLQEYKVQNNNLDIFLLSINPEITSMQKQLKRHGSLASTVLLQRLTKPIVPDYYLIVLQRILFLLSKFKVNYQVINFTNDINFQPVIIKTTFMWKKINQILGTSLSLEEIINIFQLIGIKIEYNKNNNEILHIEAPSHRNDLTNVNDFAEEIARIIGYDNLPTVKPKINVNFKDVSLLNKLLDRFYSFLINNGFHQVKTYNLTNKNSIKDFNFFNYHFPIILSAPLTSAREVMRLSLVESLIEIYCNNLLYKQGNLNFFCDNVIYTSDDHPDQQHLAFLIGKDFLPKSLTLNTSGFYLATGVLKSLLSKDFGTDFSDSWTYQKVKSNKVHPYLSTNITYNNMQFATIGRLHPQIMRQLNLTDEFYFIELNCSRLETIWKQVNDNKTSKYVPWPKFNPLSRDISVTISNDVNFMQIKQTILKKDIINLVNINFVDIYSDDKLQKEERHALTFNLQFNNDAEQLTESKITKSIETIQKIVVENFDAQLR